MVKQAIIVFTRWPEPGRVKTRLVPALGPEGAADLHRQMTSQTVGRAWAFSVSSSTRLIVAHEGGTTGQMRGWLGPLEFMKQISGDLGARLIHAVSRVHALGAERIVVVGSDCPALGETHFREAFDLLERHDLVLGPVHDGGYALVGLRRLLPMVFEDIPWSTSGVTMATLRQAERHCLTAAHLNPLADIDNPDDLVEAEVALAKGRSVSVIIPAWNEAAALGEVLPLVQAARPHETIVADGGSSDGTREVAASSGARVIRSARGRARQMNEGAQHAEGEFLLFLHADTLPPENYPGIVRAALAPGVAAGAFRFALRESIPLGAMVERVTRWRGTVLKLPYGDQGLFLRRSVFQALGGFAEWPILEDLEMIRRLRLRGRLVLTPEVAATSARRWQHGGVLKTLWRHQLIMAGHFLGIPPQRLARWR